MIWLIVLAVVFVVGVVLFAVEQHIAATPPELRTHREQRFLAADRVVDRGLQFALRWIVPIGGVIVGVVFVVWAATVPGVRTEAGGTWLGVGIFIIVVAIGLFVLYQQRHARGDDKEFDPVKTVRRPVSTLIASAFIVTYGVIGVLSPRTSGTEVPWSLAGFVLIGLGLSFAVAAVLQVRRSRQGERQQDQA